MFRALFLLSGLVAFRNPGMMKDGLVCTDLQLHFSFFSSQFSQYLVLWPQQGRHLKDDYKFSLRNAPSRGRFLQYGEE